jgi:hypothetical protein
MVLEMIAIGVIGAVYVTGNKDRKEKMRNIGFGIVDVTKDVVIGATIKTKELVKKIKEKNDSKPTDSN